VSKKIFVSYKYGDENVHQLKSPLEEYLEPTKVRDYVTKLQELIGENNINKGENDGEDLSNFSDETIASNLRDKIYDSSVTIVMISPNMKESGPEKDQWIPWEVAYSLRETTRNDRTSYTNAVLAVVLPDRNNSYEYYITNNTCADCTCRTLNTPIIFQILRKNMFNKKELDRQNCSLGNDVYTGKCSYISSVTWRDFCKDIDSYIDNACSIRDSIDGYDITKQID